MTSPRTLPDLLFHACAAHPNHGLTFAEAPGSVARVPYPALLDQARVRLAGLRTLGARKGDEVVISIALPSGFLPVFWACQLGGMVAVPAAPLTGSADTVELERLDAICRTLQRPVVVCDDRARARIAALLARSGGDGRVVGAESLCADGASDAFDPGAPDDLAMVQFSSGSTRAPKGVALRHRNLVANCLQMTSRLSLTHHDVEVGWMPLFHDMGLIGCHIALTLVGARQVKIPAAAFLERPAVWLRAATQAQATLLAGTNTALRLLLRRVDPSMAASFDLRSVRNFLVGAEPVFPAVVRATQSLLSSAGLPPTALRVAYGLAECCVGVAFDPPDRSFSSREVSRAGLGERALRAPAGASDTYEVSEIGPAYDGCEVRVVDDDDGALEDGRVGHLQVRGPQVMAGYLRDAAATEAAFCGEWLRTGDLGYLLDGRLGVCGRAKETLIVAGRNVFASDAESVAASVEGVQSAIIAPVADSEEGTEAAAMFVVLTEPDSPAAPQVLESARRKVQRVARLPLGWVVPVSRKEIPRTSSGKVRRLAMVDRLVRGDLDDRVARVRAARWSAVGGAPPDPLESRIRELWGRVLRMPPEAIGVDDPFLDLGGSSVAALEVLTLTEALVGRKLGQEMLASCSTVKQTAAWIRAGALETPTAVSARPVLREPTDGLAITAIACRFPGARDAEELHDRLLAGECRIVEPPRDRMGAASLERLGTARGSFLEDPYAFDASFFRIPEAEARLMDPQQRLVLELAAEALESAGLGEQRRRGLTIGTFLGVSATPYRAALPSPARVEDFSRTLESLPAWRALPQPARDAIERDLASRAKNAELAPTALVGNLLNMVAARLAHAFDLTGPSMAIDSACSSSLVAVHLACEALKRGECDVALAGGVHLSLDPDVWHFLKAAGVLSPTGRCVPFADGADGIVPGEGGAILVLRRWSDARAAADPVRAAILGSAIGGDGRAISPMVPNPRGQRATIEAAYRNAGVEPQSIAALEAHGTGTLIGDPIELGVQAEVFSLAPAASIAVGSVKSNLGHLLAAAGIAGLTKMIVSLERRELPPTLHAQPPNPRLPLANSPLRIAHRRTRLDASHPLRAGVSAFGFGGTNAHVVLERAEPVAARPIPLPACALPLSAPSREHLEDWARALAECDVPTEPLCRELSRGRTTHATRAVRVLRTGDDARASLSDFAAGRVGDWLLGNPEPMAGAGLAVLLFPGQGAQSVQQARGLLECWPAFRERFTGLIEKSQAQEDLFAACYGAGASDASVRRTDIAQPLLVAFQIALAQTVIDAGISPLAVVGHSVGELSAAAIAGAMDPAQAVQLAAVRGSLMQQRCRPGAMIAVALPADSLAPYLADHLDSLSIASLNAPDQTVVAGAPDAITALASRLERDAVAVVRIAVEHAFHSPLVLPVLDELEQHCRTIETRDPVVPLASTVHGRFAGPGELDAQYWRDHAALPVRFEEALRAAAGEPQDGMRASWFLEIGPGTALSKLAKRILGRGDVRPVVSLCRNPSDRDDGADVARALHALGSGWVCGASVDWARFQPSTPGAFARIPSIPFRRKHLRIDEPSAPKATRLIHRWVWEELPRSPAKPSADGDWLVIGSPAADPLVIALRESGRRVIRALPSQSFAHRSDDELSLDPSDVTQWQRALEAIDSAGRSLAGWVIAAPHDRDDAVRWIHASVAASPSSRGAPSAWIIVDDSAPEPSSRAAIATFAAAALDERESRGRVVELAGSLDESSAREVIEELGSEGPRRIRLDGVRIAPRVIAAQGLSFDGPEPFRAGAIYLVIGGTGGVGSLIAQRIAARGGNVVLASRGTAPAALLSTLETYGVGASHVSMDATSEASVRTAVARTIALHGAIHGVVFAAGVADGRPVSMSESEELLDTIRTKALGAAHLARALRGCDVDWVLLTSSVAALLPALGRGLAAYAAANASLDALAMRMRAQGAPWTSVSFALWRGVGMARRPGLLEAVEHAEGKAIDPAEALDALELALRCGVGHCVVADPADARVHATHEPARHRAARDPVREPVAREAAPGEPLDDTLETFLRRRISQATGVAAPAISPTASFASLGLDSLASVEIARTLEKRIGRPLRPTLLFENDTLARLLTVLEAPVQTPRPSEVRSASRLPARFPLMPSQATFLAQNAFHPEIPSYVFLCVRLRGTVQPEWLDRSLLALTNRHEMLRVVFDWHDGKPTHRVVENAPPAIEVVDLPDDPGEGLRRFEHVFRNRPFDLATTPAYRLALVRLDAKESALLFSAHHILCDAWSAQILLTELLQGHEACREGKEPAWPPLESSFADCVDAYLRASEANVEDRAFWREELRDAPLELPLPFDGDPAEPPVGPCGLVETRLDGGQTEALESLARAWDVSLFQVVSASYYACLHRWTGRGDVMVRVAQARREGRLPGIEAVFGSFADSLPVRLRQVAGAGVRDLAGLLKTKMLEVQRHAAISSLEIANLHGHRSAGGPRGITPAGLSFPAFPPPERLGELSVAGLRGGAVSGFTQLGLIVYRSGPELHFSWNFHETLFRETTIQRLAQEHLASLTVEVGAPRAPMPARAPAPNRLLHERIAATVQRCPDRVAVDGDEPMTYGELGDRSGRLAAALAESGVGQGDLVAVLGYPRADSIAAIVGVLRSGAAYLPLDPAYPQRRIADVLAHAGVRTVVTANAHLPLLAESTAGLERVLLTDEHTGIEAEPGRVVSWSEIATLPLREPLDPATEESLAYVMYTSGTTGHPKGVMVTHRAVATFHAWIESAFGVTDQDRFIPTSSIAFGASLRQLFSPLMAGARVVPAPPHLLRDPHALAGFLEERGISFWNSVPTLWGQLIDAIEEREREGLETRLEALRWVLIGGEDLPASLVRRWMDRFGARHRIVNLFGCAETIVNSVTHELRERPGPHERTIPIGRARRGVQAYVLDDDGNPCGSGEVGILHIGGEALAEGYMNEPELTRRAFPSTRWGRLYRTGDLARQDDQGIITYLGRGDDRVKVRGNRVELSEIEGTLRNHPEVRDAACASFQREGREWLVAFVILPQNAPPGWESALRDWVARHLPSYMVPHRFVQVQSFPLNANGKVDRRALGENLSAPRSSAGDGELTPTERTVLETWKEVLGELAVDRELDFFEAGGDSILAIEMFRRLRGRIAVVPRPVAIYANRTVAKLAQAIEELALTSGAVATPPTRRVEAGRLPLTPAQAGFVFLEDSLQREAPVWFADVPVHGEVDPERFRNALAEVIRRHPMLRAVFRREGAQWFQQVLPPCDPPLFIHDAPLDQQELQEVWADVRATRFELSQLPLFRVVLVRSATGPWRLMLAVHHIIGDAWSLHVVIEDLASALAGEELPALDASWSELVAWHARTDPHRQASKDYWRGFFSRAPSPVRWAPSQGEELEGTLVRTVDPAVTARLREIARARATTLHACVLTVWFQSLRSELGEDDLTTGTASGGREIPVPDVERMVGCLATTLPVRAKVSGDFDTDLRAVSMAWEEAWQHGDVPVYESWLAAGAPHGSQAPGLDLYFSFMEFGSLAARRDAPLRFDLSSAELHFSTDSAGHRAMLTVLVDDAIRLQLRGDGSADRLRALAERMARGLEQLAGRTRAGDAVRSVKDDAAIVAYLPSLAGLTGALDSGADPHSLREHVLPRLFPRGEPQWMESTQTPLGRTAAVFLPLFSDELAQIPAETLAASVASAVRVAHARGARSVSLAGMLPSLTSYGHAVRRLLDPESAASLTTGHAATTAAVVATIRRALVALQRTWADQRVAIVGFGSMGQGIAGLMLSVLGRPRGLVVCDRREALPLVAEAVHALERAGQVPVTMVGANREGLPDAVYDCEVVVGATSRGGILDVRRLADGAVLADDSFPPVYDRAHLVREVLESKRVLVVGAGRLSLSSDAVERRALELPGAVETAALSLAQETGAAGMPGCRVESLLVASHGLRALSGLVDREHAQEAWELLAKLGVDAAPLHVGGLMIPDEVLEALKK